MGIMRRSGRDNAVIFTGHDKEKVSYCEECEKVKVLSVSA